MLLSGILPDMGINQFTIMNEQGFDAFAVVNVPADLKCLTFAVEERYLANLPDSVSMVLVSKEFEDFPLRHDCGRCVVSDPRLLYYKAHNHMAKSDCYARKGFDTRIGIDCEISPLSSISQRNVIIGDNVVIEEFVVIRENTQIGDNTVIRAGTVIGGQGFEMKRDGEKVFRVEHLGGVIIGKHVEIQQNSCVERALYPWHDTIIGDYCKIDSLAIIGHAARLGRGAIVVSLSGIGGSSVVGDDAWIGLGVAVRDGIHIGNRARVNIGSVVTKDVPDDGSVTGNFAIEHSRFMAGLKKSLAE